MGFQMMTVAQGWLVFDLTGSALFLGYVGLAAGLPAIVLNLIGGVIADKVGDKRRLLVATQSISSLVMLLLATLALLGACGGLAHHCHRLPHRLRPGFRQPHAAGDISPTDRPGRHDERRGSQLHGVAGDKGGWAGAGGVIIGTKLGVAPGFYAPFLGFLFMAIMVSTLRLPPSKRAESASFTRDMIQGINFVRSNRIFTYLIGMTFFNSMFGMSYIFLFPVFARDIFEAGPAGLGLMSAATGIGALLGTLATASLGNFRQKGWLLLGGAVMFGVFLILFAATGAFLVSFPLALGLIFLAGASTSIYMITVMSTLQTLVPNELRGRVMGIYGMTWSLMPLGAMQAGVIAEFTSAPFAVAVGGAAVILFAVGMSMSSRLVRNLGAQADAVP